ncbi:MAG: DUF6159 family protein [Candidatus Helarchaeota archaeon]
MSEEKEKKARIESLLEGQVPINLPKGKFIALILSWIIFIGIGIFALFDLYGPWVSTIAWISALLAFELWLPIFILLIIAGGFIVLTIYTMVKLLKNHGTSLLKFSIVFFCALIWVSFVVILLLVGTWMWEMMFILIVAIASTILTILYFTVWKTRLELAGGILELTGKVTHEEKGLFVPGFMKVLFIGLFTLFGTIIGIDLIAHTIPTVNALWYHYIPVICYTFVMYLYLYVNTYFFNAIITAITYIWYRKKDPSFRDGVVIATYQLPDLTLFALFSAIIRIIRALIRSLARKNKAKLPWTGGGFRLADGIIGSVWMYVNYFTLPSIVIEDVPATTAIKRSAHRLFDNWVDLLLKKWGIGFVFTTLQFLIIILFAIGGGIFSFIMKILFIPTLPLDPWLWILIIVGVIIFLIISTIVSKPFLNLLNDIYITFLFGFVIDKESNFKYENNLPKELNEKLNEWFEQHPVVRRCQKCFAKVPEGASSCPKCGAPYP